MTNYIQTLKRFNAWCRGEETIEVPNPEEIGHAIDRLIYATEEIQRDRDDWRAEADMRSKEIDIWKRECQMLRQELKKADQALEDNVAIFNRFRQQIIKPGLN